MPTVVIAYNQFPDISTEERILSQTGAAIIHTGTLDTDEALEAVRTADALMVTTHKLTADFINTLEQCKIICRIGTGLDSIDIPAATERGIWVTNVPDYSVDEVSTHAVALMLAHHRRLPRMFEMVQTDVWWDKNAIEPIRRLTTLTLGVLSYGRIGRTTAIKGRGLGMRVIAHDPYIANEAMAADGVEPVSLDELFARSDYLSLHTPLTDSTRNIINRASLATMKPTAFLINTARGALVDEDALLEAVHSGVIAGAALDVLQKEPPSADHPLRSDPRIWLTPHAGWYSEDSSDDVRVKGTEDVVRVLNGQAPRTPANSVAIR
jgi:D-3-phosphoglycerate dehydrogenase / 2-oxoglutarate reductase